MSAKDQAPEDELPVWDWTKQGGDDWVDRNSDWILTADQRAEEVRITQEAFDGDTREPSPPEGKVKGHSTGG